MPALNRFTESKPKRAAAVVVAVAAIAAGAVSQGAASSSQASDASKMVQNGGFKGMG